MKALELAEAAVDFAQEGELIHLCSSEAICSLLAAAAAELRRLAEVNAELLVELIAARKTIADFQAALTGAFFHEQIDRMDNIISKAKEQQ